MDWASVLYHATGMFNGGGYLMEVAKGRLVDVKEREAGLQRAEAGVLSKKAEEEKAKAATAAAAEAEPSAKAEMGAAIAGGSATASEEEQLR